MVCIKQEEDSLRGDWYLLFKKDFEFIGVQINEYHIRRTPKEEYKQEIMKLIRISAFTYFMNCKETHSKLDPIHYEKFEVQKYLCSKSINNKYKKLLYLLCSRCFDAKSNFKKLFKNNQNCRFGCLVTEDQNHIFKNCQILN